MGVLLYPVKYSIHNIANSEQESVFIREDTSIAGEV